MKDLFECQKCRKLTLEFDSAKRIMYCVNPNCDMVLKPQDESNFWYTEVKNNDN